MYLWGDMISMLLEFYWLVRAEVTNEVARDLACQIPVHQPGNNELWLIYRADRRWPVKITPQVAEYTEANSKHSV